VRIFSYLEDRERTFDSPTDKFLMSAVNFAAEIERDKARQRTSDAMVRKAKSHHVTGGRVFGYSNEEISAPDERGVLVRLHVDTESTRLRRLSCIASSSCVSLACEKRGLRDC
jgi:DNA invertase Pin-like site-specific DNA recombinase